MAFFVFIEQVEQIVVKRGAAEVYYQGGRRQKIPKDQHIYWVQSPDSPSGLGDALAAERDKKEAPKETQEGEQKYDSIMV